MKKLGTRKRKIRKNRGSRTHGWGISGQHRGGGMKGGRGKAGLFKHKWTSVLARGLPIRGKHGFRPIDHRRKLSAMNVRELDEIADKLIATGKEKNKSGKIKINLTLLGYDKLLGVGKITKPLEINVANYSNSALEKVEEAGGSIITSKKEVKE